MFRVKQHLASGHRPGEIVSPKDLAGSDTDWLVKAGAVEPIAGLAAAPNASTEDLQAEVEMLTERVGQLESDLEAVTKERDEFKAAAGGIEKERQKAAESLDASAAEVNHLRKRVAELQEQFNALSAKLPSPTGEPNVIVTQPEPEPGKPKRGK